MPIFIEDQWDPLIDEICKDKGLTLVMGGTDTGKTSFVLHFINKVISKGYKVAVLDGDIGQSEIGIPGIIAYGIATNQIESIKDIIPVHSYFIGTTSLIPSLLDAITGMRVLLDKISAEKFDLCIVDTCGFVSGINARRFNTSVLQVLHPKHIIAIQKSNELDHILKYFQTLQDIEIHELAVSEHVHTMSQLIRRQRRSIHFDKYFREGRIHHILIKDIVLNATWLGNGTVMDLRNQKYAQKVLNTTVFYGEESANGICLITSGDGNENGLEELQEYFKTKIIVIIPANRYLNLFIGLLDAKHNLVGCGIIRRIDFTSGIISFFSPIKTVGSIKIIKFGSLKLRPDGTEIGFVNPKEI